jgi:hypothetical protein
MNKIVLENHVVSFFRIRLGKWRMFLLNVVIVTCLLIAGTAKPAETAVAMERLCKHIRSYEIGQWISRDGGRAYHQQ